MGYSMRGFTGLSKPVAKGAVFCFAVGYLPPGGVTACPVPPTICLPAAAPKKKKEEERPDPAAAFPEAWDGGLASLDAIVAALASAGAPDTCKAHSLLLGAQLEAARRLAAVPDCQHRMTEHACRCGGPGGPRGGGLTGHRVRQGRSEL